MKYHSLLTANNGLNTPFTNPCKLLEFGFLKLAAGETYSAESGDLKNRRTRSSLGIVRAYHLPA